MYLNLKQFQKSNLTPEELIQLLAIKQKESELIKEEFLERFDELGYTKYIKGGKSSTKTDLVRLSPSGEKLLVKLSFEGSADEETEKLAEFLIKVYKTKNGGIVKNKTELKRRLQWMKETTGIKGNFLAILLQLAISDTYSEDCGQNFKEFKKENPRAILSNICENLIWTPSSHFNRHYNLSQSPLYTYFEDNEEYVRRVWEAKLDENGNVKR